MPRFSSPYTAPSGPFSGWILDAYPASNGMRVWIQSESGRAFSCLDPWLPFFYLETDLSRQERLERLLSSFQTPFSIRVVEKREFFSNAYQPVLEVRVGNPLIYSRVVKTLLSLAESGEKGRFSLYNADINLTQLFFYERGLFPLAFCAGEISEEGRVRAWRLADSCWDIDYALPPLRFAHLGFDPQHGGDVRESISVNPNQAPGGSRGRGRRGAYLLTLGRELGKAESYVLDDSEEELIRSLNRHMAEWDPDILLTDWGDSYIMPRLQMHAERTGVPLRLSRDESRVMSAGADHTFFSYGKMFHRSGPRTLYGRLHLDTRNSFMMGQSDLEGLIEIARVARMPLQRAARCTIGTSLSSIQQNWAVQNDYLIPLDKVQTEDFRSGDELVLSDRGGLVYEPEIGWHEDLVEYDFVSMYPEIMIRHNVTPEAVNCACCPDNKAPEINHHLCRKRIGMVPQTLAPIVAKRRRYKDLIARNHPNKAVYKRRSDAFKWALVTCFGYLGFRNARFGRIEAHECVNAYSREALLKAKETAEKRGFHFLHAIVDSLWLRKPGVSEVEVEDLRIEIEKETGLPLGFEGRYRWIRFCQSKMNRRVGVPTRYFGAFVNGDLKVRGIELRRHDTPPLILKLQQALLDVMAEAKSIRELERMKPRLSAIIESARDRLRSGAVSPLDIAMTFRLSKDPSEYLNDTLSALAAKKMEAGGAPVHAGEVIRYIVTQERDKVKDWRVTPLAFIDDYFEYDIAYYEKLIDRAIDITPFFPYEEKRKVRAVKVKESRQLVFEWGE